MSEFKDAERLPEQRDVLQFEDWHHYDARMQMAEWSDADLLVAVSEASTTSDNYGRAAREISDKARNWHQIGCAAQEILDEREIQVLQKEREVEKLQKDAEKKAATDELLSKRFGKLRVAARQINKTLFPSYSEY